MNSRINRNGPANGFFGDGAPIEAWVDFAPAIVHVTDGDGNIRSVSQLWIKKFGYSRDEVFGRKWIDLLTLDSRLHAQTTVIQAISQTGHCENAEFQIACKNKQLIDVLLSARRHHDPQDGDTIVAVITDITEQKEAERKLIESESRYRGIVEDQAELIMLTDLDSNLKFVNHAFARHHGVDADEIIGRNMYDFVPTHYVDQVREQMRRTIASTETLHDENEVLLHDGSSRWIAWSNRAIRDQNGEIVAIHSVGRDIDDRKRTEMRLQQSEARYRMLADHSTDLVFQYDQDMVRRYVSPACREIFGVEPEDMIGRKSFLETHPDEIDKMKQAYEDLASGRQERASLVYRIKHQAGHWVWVEAAIRGTRDPITNEPTGLIGAIRDITAKKEIEEKLAEANRRLEILAAQDGLTEIYNRRTFDEMLAREMKISQRDGSSLSLLMIDVDVFKPYNDTYGHLAGDAVLKKVSDAIKTSVKRPRDLAARYGGEEFVVLLPGTDHLGASIVAELVRKNVQELALAHGASPWLTVTVSVGVASAHNSDPDSLNQDTLILRADNALYLAKNSGRNTVAIWRPEHSASRPSIETE